MVTLNPAAPPSSDASRPSAPGERTPATAGGVHRVVTGDSLWKLAEEAYGDGTKWTLIRDANPKHVKMRKDTPVIQPGAELTIPAAPEGWVKKGTAAKPSQTREPLPEASAVSAPPGGPLNAGQVVALTRQNLTALEFQLSGLTSAQREALIAGVRSGRPPQPHERGPLEAARKLATESGKQLSQLSPDDFARATALLGSDQGKWPLSETLLEAVNARPARRQEQAREAPRTAAAIEAAQRDSLLEVHELGTVLRSVVADIKAHPPGEQRIAAATAATALLEAYVSRAQGKSEQLPALQNAVGQIAELNRLGATVEQFDELGRALEHFPSASGTTGTSGPTGTSGTNGPAAPAADASGLPKAELAPTLSRVADQALKDGAVSATDLVGMLHALAEDLRKNAPQEPRKFYQQVSPLMMHVFQRAKFPDIGADLLNRTSNVLGRLFQGNGTARDVEQLADEVQRGEVKPRGALEKLWT